MKLHFLPSISSFLSGAVLGWVGCKGTQGEGGGWDLYRPHPRTTPPRHSTPPPPPIYSHLLAPHTLLTPPLLLLHPTPYPTSLTAPKSSHTITPNNFCHVPPATKNSSCPPPPAPQLLTRNETKAWTTYLYKDTKPYMSSLLVFNRVYRLESGDTVMF
jgi:hypothetical protein